MKHLKQQISKLWVAVRGGMHEDDFTEALLALFNEAVSEIIGEDSNSLEMNGDAIGGYNHAKAEQRLKQKEVLK